MAEIEVVGAVIREGRRILCAQRGPQQSLPGMWEFPGGKIEPGEGPDEALRREIQEELGCLLAVGEEIIRHTHHYPNITIVLTTYWCALEAGVPAASEHAQLSWVDFSELAALDWAPADIPTVKAIQAVLSNAD